MELKLTEFNSAQICEVSSDKIEINEVQDALDIIGNCMYQGADSIVLYEKNITPQFFDLKTGIAGEILQKFSNYGIRLAVVGSYAKFSSQSLQDFMSESNKGGRINFVSSFEEAITKLSLK